LLNGLVDAATPAALVLSTHNAAGALTTAGGHASGLEGTYRIAYVFDARDLLEALACEEPFVVVSSSRTQLDEASEELRRGLENPHLRRIFVYDGDKVVVFHLTTPE